MLNTHGTRLQVPPRQVPPHPQARMLPSAPPWIQHGCGQVKKEKKKKKNKRQAVVKQHNLWDLLWSRQELAAQILQQLHEYPFPKLRMPSQNPQPNTVRSLKPSSKDLTLVYLAVWIGIRGYSMASNELQCEKSKGRYISNAPAARIIMELTAGSSKI